MYEGNIQIDNPENDWTPEAVERLFIFCQLDRAMPYEKVVESYNAVVEDGGIDSFQSVRNLTMEELTTLLTDARLRFPKDTALYLHYNARTFDGKTLLLKMDRDEIVEKCPGFGYKLASMFCNRCQGTQYAIIDVHVDRFLSENGCTAKSYKEKEKFFIDLAHKMGMTTDELDWKIWDERRIGHRK